MVSGASGLDFSQLQTLSFELPDAQRFPGLQLAWDTLRGPEGSTAILNAANEVAVAAFLERAIRFDQIHAVNVAVLDAVAPPAGAAQSVAGLLELDAAARRAAAFSVQRLSA
jgi:1-deoxy-D-xylulose-5-phosphate reductoisomerase